MPHILAGSLALIWLQKPCQNVSGAAATQRGRICRKNGIEIASEFGRISGTDLAPKTLPKCERCRGHRICAAKCQQIWPATARILVQNLRGCAARPWRMLKLLDRNHTQAAQNRRDSRQQLRRCWPLAVFWDCSGLLGQCWQHVWAAGRYRQDSGEGNLGLLEGSCAAAPAVCASFRSGRHGALVAI